MKRISIDPITRLEGHGKIDIFLNEEGEVANAYLQVPELRGFERFCVGRPAEDMPNITNRICGVCPEAHHMASTKALDALFHVDPPPTAKKLRELFYSIFFATDHTTHFYALAGPDFIMGPDAPVAERNILGVIKKVGMDIAGKVLKMRHDGHHLIKMIGGRPVHPNWGLPGGVSRGITEEQREEIEKLGREAIEFGKFSLQLFNDIVLGNTDYVDLIKNDAFVHATYNMGTVDESNHVNFYDGKIRIVGPDGKEHAIYDPKDYQEYIAERVEPWSYLKFPYLKKIGWKGFVDGVGSGVYKATPLSRLNAAYAPWPLRLVGIRRSAIVAESDGELLGFVALQMGRYWEGGTVQAPVIARDEDRAFPALLSSAIAELVRHRVSQAFLVLPHELRRFSPLLVRMGGELVGEWVQLVRYLGKAHGA